MGWFKVDDHYFEHYKVLEAGPGPADLNLRGIAYCSRNQTDGKIPFAAVALLAPERDVSDDIEVLLDVGLWRKSAKHYVIHDYLDHQSSRAQIRKRQDAAKERARKSRRDKSATTANRHTNVRELEAEADTDVDTDTEADRLSTGNEISTSSSSMPVVARARKPEYGEAEPIGSILAGQINDQAAA